VAALAACSSHHASPTAAPGPPTDSDGPSPGGAVSAPATTDQSATPGGSDNPPLYNFAAIRGGSSATAVAAGLKARWHLEAGKPTNTENMVQTVYRAGTSTAAKGREIGAIFYARGDSLLYLTCSGGGSKVEQRKDTALRDFIYDCAQRAAPATGWAALKAWLDAHYWNTTPPESKIDGDGFHADLEVSSQGVRLQITGPVPARPSGS
jgi:hypothetical protein